MQFKKGDWVRCKVHGLLLKIVAAPSQGLLLVIGRCGTTSAGSVELAHPTDLEKREVMNDWAIHALIRLKLNMQQAIRNGWPTEPYKYKASI